MATHDLKQIWFNREINQRLEEVLRGIAASHLNIVENGMRFQNLKQDKKILRLANGIIIESSICFGKQTARVYVPPVPPVKRKPIEEEDRLILNITREYDDEPLTPENIYYSSGLVNAYVMVYEAVLQDEHWVIGENIFTFMANLPKTTGTLEIDGDILTYTKSGASAWGGKYNYATNEWEINISESAPVKSSSGKYIVAARFNQKSLITVYPRVYKYNEQWALAPDDGYYMTPPANKDACKAIEPGTYTMTIPYYEITKDVVGYTFGGGYTPGLGEDPQATETPKVSTHVVKSTVPVVVSAGIVSIGNTSEGTYITEALSTIEELEDGYACSVQNYDIRIGAHSPGFNNDVSAIMITGEVTDSADIEICDGQNTESYTYRYNRPNGTHYGTIEDGDTKITQSGWQTPPDPVEREGQPPYRDIIEVDSYVSAKCNLVEFQYTTNKAYDAYIGYLEYGFNTWVSYPLSCENTARTYDLSLIGNDIQTTSTYFLSVYDEADL